VNEKRSSDADIPGAELLPRGVLRRFVPAPCFAARTILVPVHRARRKSAYPDPTLHSRESIKALHIAAPTQKVEWMQRCVDFWGIAYFGCAE
jgi:hypothetical protein